MIRRKWTGDVPPKPVILFEFENGWTAKIVMNVDGTANCWSFPTETEGHHTNIEGPVNAVADEVAMFIVSIQTRRSLLVGAA